MGNTVTHPADQGPPLIIEVERTNDEFLRTLRYRASMSGDMAFSAAAANNLTSWSRLLSSRTGVKRVDREGFGVLHWAIFAGWEEGVRVAIEQGADVNQASKEGYTPLHVAAFMGDTASASHLLKAGANINALSTRSAPAVAIAAQMGGVGREVLRLLVSHKANVSNRGFRNRSPLELALLAHGEGETIRILLEGGADPCSKNETCENVTPLHLAAHLLHCDAARALLDHGASPDARADHGVTPTMQALMSHRNGSGPGPGPGGEHPNDANNEAPSAATAAATAETEAAKVEMFRLLRDSGADLDVTMPRGMTVLHVAMTTCKAESSVETVMSSVINISNGINLQFTGAKNSMLHLCARNNWERIIQRLVNEGADLNLRNKEGFTPLHVAVNYGKAGSVAALLHAGADPYVDGPDIWPNLSRWRARRSVRAAHALLHAQPGQRPSDILRELRAGEPKSSAVDTAVKVTRQFKVVEAFVAHGARPTEEALQLGELGAPLLRPIVERAQWTPELHRQLPPRFKAAAKELVKVLPRAAADSQGNPMLVPPNVVVDILTAAMYPLTEWADSAWLAEQIRPVASAAGDGEGEEGGAGGGGGGGHGAAINAAVMQAMPELMDHVLQHLFQDIAQELVNNGPGGEALGAAAAAVAAAAVDDAGAGGGAGGPANAHANAPPHPAVHNNNNHPHQHQQPQIHHHHHHGPIPVNMLPPGFLHGIPPGAQGTIEMFIMPGIPGGGNFPFPPGNEGLPLGMPMPIPMPLPMHHHLHGGGGGGGGGGNGGVHGHGPGIQGIQGAFGEMLMQMAAGGGLGGAIPHGGGGDGGGNGGNEGDGGEDGEEEEEEEVHVMQFHLQVNLQDLFPNGIPAQLQHGNAQGQGQGQGGGGPVVPPAAPAPAAAAAVAPPAAEPPVATAAPTTTNAAPAAAAAAAAPNTTAADEAGPSETGASTRGRRRRAEESTPSESAGPSTRSKRPRRG